MGGWLDSRMRYPWGRGRVWLWIVWLTVAAVGLPGSGSLWAQASNEADRLRVELEQARQEIQQLREENARLRAGGLGSAAIAPVTTGGAVPLGAPAGVVPLGGASAFILPSPLPEGATVSMDQLLADYGASALAADARYRGRRLRLEGTVHGFRKVFVGMTWVVLLQADNRLGQVRASVNFSGISDFRQSADEKRLEGRRPFKAWQTLVEVGQAMVLEGVVEGLDGSVIVMKDAKVLTDR